MRFMSLVKVMSAVSACIMLMDGEYRFDRLVDCATLAGFNHSKGDRRRFDCTDDTVMDPSHIVLRLGRPWKPKPLLCYRVR